MWAEGKKREKRGMKMTFRKKECSKVELTW
jgi:hypothetical protein